MDIEDEIVVGEPLVVQQAASDTPAPTGPALVPVDLAMRSIALAVRRILAHEHPPLEVLERLAAEIVIKPSIVPSNEPA